ncbi:DUF461 domain-containing protein [Streptomyces sp. 21So2-11]|uniref:DUF461 domain-containing protein n=1 Tax=Streptomyces sp. 21So2-11 TaxID=3144408 RepID=UPI00321A2679
MSRSHRRGAIAATAVVFSIASLAACGAGNDAQTLGVRPDNAAAAVDDIKIQNATIVTQPEPGAEGPAAVTVTIFNNGAKAETLESIGLPGTDAKVKLSPAKGKGPVSIPAGGSIVLGGKGNASAVIDKGAEAAKNGDAQPIVFQLSDTGAVKMRAFVVPAKHDFKDVGPSALPELPATKPSGSATTSPSGSPTGSPSGSPSEAASGAAGASTTTGPSGGASASHAAGAGAGH